MTLEKTMKVYPSLKMHPLEYVPGLGEDGAELPIKEAEALIEAGLAVKSKPSAKPAEKEKPE